MYLSLNLGFNPPAVSIAGCWLDTHRLTINKLWEIFCIPIVVHTLSFFLSVTNSGCNSWRGVGSSGFVRCLNREILYTPFRSSKVLSNFCWKYSSAGEIPHAIRLQQYRPHGVWKVIRRLQFIIFEVSLTKAFNFC